jgi:hypothetical protein
MQKSHLCIPAGLGRAIILIHHPCLHTLLPRMDSPRGLHLQLHCINLLMVEIQHWEAAGRCDLRRLADQVRRHISRPIINMLAQLHLSILYTDGMGHLPQGLYHPIGLVLALELPPLRPAVVLLVVRGHLDQARAPARA